MYIGLSSIITEFRKKIAQHNNIETKIANKDYRFLKP